MTFDQSGFDVRCEWGENGIRHLAPVSDVVVISHLKGSLAPEAGAALSAYLNVKPDLTHMLKQCGSGRELIGRGFERDVEIASELNISECVPTLVDGAYVKTSRPTPEF